MNLDKFCAMSFRKANIFADFKFDRMGLIHLSLASGGGKTFAESPRGFHPETFATYYYSIMRCNSWSKTFQYNQREQVYAALKPTKDLVDIRYVIFIDEDGYGWKLQDSDEDLVVSTWRYENEETCARDLRKVIGWNAPNLTMLEPLN